MFRSTTNIRGRSFDDDDDPTAWLRMAARGIHDEEPTSFFTTNIPRDNDQFYPTDSYCLCDSIKYNVCDTVKDDVNNNKNVSHIPHLSYRAKIYAIAEETQTNNNNRTENKHAAPKKKFDKKIKISRSLDRIELNGHKYKVHVKSRKVRSFDNAIDIAEEKDDWRSIQCALWTWNTAKVLQTLQVLIKSYAQTASYCHVVVQGMNMCKLCNFSIILFRMIFYCKL